MKTIYVDNNATTQVAPEVYRAMVPFLTEHYFNPSSMYQPAQRTAAAAISDARETDRSALSAACVRTRSFSRRVPRRATTWRFWGQPRPTRTVVTSSPPVVEHPAVLEVCKDLERTGYEVTYLASRSPRQPQHG